MMPRLYRSQTNGIGVWSLRWGSLVVELSYGDGVAIVVGWDR